MLLPILSILLLTLRRPCSSRLPRALVPARASPLDWDWTTSNAARPLKFITGRGNHSVGRVGVLGPAVRSALVEDGWNVSTWDAGLVVRGRR